MKDFGLLRQQMVDEDLRKRGITNERVLSAFLKVPREEFIPDELKEEAYADYPLPIGQGQTISQPFVVALMTEALEVKADDRILEVGTGSGYQAAILSLLCKEVFTIERIESLGKAVQEKFKRLGFFNIKVKNGDGSLGWKDRAQFDGIMVTAAAAKVPPALKEQLRIGGRLVIPVNTKAGLGHQDLLVLAKNKKNNFIKENLGVVAFVPLIGQKDH